MLKNIFEVWRHFNNQQKLFKGPTSSQWMKGIEQTTSSWESEDYPNGEYWKYLSFGDLKTTRLVSAQAQAPKNEMNQSENGVYININDFAGLTDIKPVKLPDGLKIYNHKEVIESDELSKRFGTLIKKTPDNNLLSQVPMSFAGLGLFVIVEKSVKLNKPLFFVFDLNGLSEKDSLAPFSLQILLEEESSADIYIETQAEQFVGFSNIRIDGKVHQRAQLNLLLKEKGGSQSRNMLHNFIDVEERAQLNFFDLTLPNQWTRHNTVISLMEPQAEVSLQGIYLNDQDYFSDHHTEIRHLKEHTISRQNYKGILSGRAKAVFNGKVFIEKMARKSSSEQMNNNLMLSKKSEVDTKPELQIYNDDVKATHGATIGKIDEEQLFYLQSRGYSKNQAWRALAKAFVYGSLENLPDQAQKFFSYDISQSLEKFEEL